MNELTGLEQLFVIPVNNLGQEGAYTRQVSTASIAALGGLSARVELTSAQLLNLHAAPVTLIPAPGAGRFTLVLLSVYETVWETAGYAMSPNTDPPTGSVGLWYGSTAGSQVDVMALAIQPLVTIASAVSITTCSFAGYGTAYIENMPIILGVAEGFSLVVGDGSAVVQAKYLVLDL